MNAVSSNRQPKTSIAIKGLRDRNAGWLDIPARRFAH